MEYTAEELEALRRFTVNLIENEAHKKLLKRLGFIQWSHGMWSLTHRGQEVAKNRKWI